MSKNIIITGATSGFGEATAQLLAQSGYHLILIGRREERLKMLAENLKSYPIQIHTLVMDVRDRKATESFIHALPDHFKHIDILVNNAGLALGRDNFNDANLDDWDTMVDTNLKGLSYMAHAVSKNMVAHGNGGHIINIGSTAGKDVYIQGNMYCATKHAVRALSESMRIDLLPHGIKVTNIQPGAAYTEFSKVRFKGDETTANSVYKGIEPLIGDDIANIIKYCIDLPAHVCINELTVTCTQQANSYYMFRKED
ncbi:MAG: SDR family NAD(P)-dependent oxidoreductase [Chitinophagaceae bacterium]|nr:MAG: SDR family NAD(P)-dependent oxidoreductase [Chitinophagaceae bacterium]